jgi:hypothetical protein
VGSSAGIWWNSAGIGVLTGNPPIVEEIGNVIRVITSKIRQVSVFIVLLFPSVIQVIDVILRRSLSCVD